MNAMTLQLPLSPEIEAKLRERAAAEGKDPTDLAVEAIQEKLGQANGPATASTVESRGVAWDRFVTTMSKWAKHLPSGHRVDDSRDSIYDGRGQ